MACVRKNSIHARVRSSLFLPILTGLLCLLTTACATSGTSNPPLDHPVEHPSDPDSPFASNPSDPSGPEAYPDPYPGLSKEALEAIGEIEKEILQANAEIEQSEPPADGNSSASAGAGAGKHKIPLEINKNVMKWIHYFTVRDRDRFHRFLKRGSVYKSMVQDILRKNGVPTDLYYLAMIESGYVTHARSHASAVGMWQFIRGTGLRYGLSQNRSIDERRDIVRATEAASRYLRNLHTAFQSWYLAMAGYNAGEGRILGAIMRGGSRNFWELVEKKALPPETRNYVPKFLAATIIGKNPEKYGFTDIEAIPFPELEAVEVPGDTSFATISRRLDIPVSTLKTLNPQLLRDRTPRKVRQYSIWVPKDRSVDVGQVQQQLESLRYSEKKSTASQSRHVARQSRTRTRHHRVRRGENLSTIARRHGLSVSALKRMNGLRSNRVIAGKRLLVSGGKAKKKKTVVHRVRSGEALSLIASRYKVPVKKIKRMNDLRSNRIYVGQKLVIAKGH